MPPCAANANCPSPCPEPARRCGNWWTQTCWRKPWPGRPSQAASGQTFNITNGDVFVLRHAWPKLARELGLAAAGPAPTGFAEFFADQESRRAWGRIAGRHGLSEPSLDRFLGQSHHYLDLLNSARIAGKSDPVLLSTIKLRQAGFGACRDSFASLAGQLRGMADLQLLPPMPCK